MTDASEKMFTINYTRNPDRNGIYQHSAFLILAGNKTVSSYDDSTSITMVVDHKRYAIPLALGQRNGDSAQFSFIMDIRKARQFDVYVNGQRIGSFNPDVRNT